MLTLAMSLGVVDLSQPASPIGGGLVGAPGASTAVVSGYVVAFGTGLLWEFVCEGCGVPVGADPRVRAWEGASVG